MYQSQNQFKQLKWYFHISEPYQSLSQSKWYLKLQPLANLLATHYQKYLLPSSDIAVDEMMVHFTGRSVHTLIPQRKPIP